MPPSSTLYLLFVLPAAQCFEVASWSLAAAAQIFPQWLWSPPTPSPATAAERAAADGAGPSSYGDVDIEQPLDETFTQRV